jgi:prepilin-type N-terminal cleavage/methylation domain-containing protein
MTKRKAFTLVELLVVIAIISLLIAILAPSLKAAKDLARNTFCLTNLNALNKSVIVYAEQNRGYMMVYQSVFTNGYIRAPDNTYKSYACFHNQLGVNPATGLFNDQRGFGLVYALNLLGPAEMFYCPDQKDKRSTIGFYPRPWGSALPPDPGTAMIRNSYMWNPWVARIPGGQPHQWTYEDWLLPSRHPNEWFLTSDIMDRESDMSHAVGNTARWNLGYADGHAAPWESKALFNAFTVDDVDASQDWTIFNAAVRPLVPGSDVKAVVPIPPL